jgi:hypothetical protein
MPRSPRSPAGSGCGSRGNTWLAIGASESFFTHCGTLASPFTPPTPRERYFCDAALAEHLVWVIVAFVVTALLVAGGVALKVSGRDPYPLY